MHPYLRFAAVGVVGRAFAALVVGGHGQLFVCRPLHEDPDFSVLTALFDRPNKYYGSLSGKPGLGSLLQRRLQERHALDVQCLSLSALLLREFLQ
ncbi:Hypothetical predicted protein [Cloeon dipterum]|uniref:Uncharacterized protein n=1 Tax=Cloeon dipterum TaxID=197152 RepID=A0A8S1D481_9INSE|nr:Hypothetical predicted protein [Cloeon dipterum]